MSYELLRQELKEGKTRGLYLFYGPEDYLIRHYAREIEKNVVEPFAKDISYSFFQEQIDLRALYDACVAYPLFGDRRLVVVKDSGLLKQGAGGGRRKKGGEGPAGAETAASAHDLSLSAIIDILPNSTCLLIIEKEVDKRLALFGKIGKKGLIVEFALRTAGEIEEWARAIAGRDGLKFTRDALRLFTELAGETMTEVRAELDKLLMYCAGGQGITRGDVLAVCGFSLKTRIFDLLDNILAGRKKQALSELDILLGEREPAMRIMAAISNHLILLRHIKGLAADGVKPHEAAVFMGLNPYRAEKLWRQSSRISPQTITAAIEQCFEQDNAIKSGRINDTAALYVLTSSFKT
jgi:DNA polymerase-3 subunit delta